ncbi:UDP-glucuronic acid decarboxylase family protein [Salinarimonas ramus]|uniref:NAD-dependent dehydratase n=1 Tax=Salinarimonas ramus TaxID=690164 RepID=A0A917V627_9HYPH|nr:UDP-glucuronic acid decarboxylase family protein [Salinarimonas ramus]GGK44853.1 NAD-dependent dehydratase [Salinarimonas ramus]
MNTFRTRKSSSSRGVLVAGGAGFLGSNLCERLIADGERVICLDNMQTGTPENLASLAREPRFSLIEQDVCDPIPANLDVEAVFNLACAASPPRYQADPVHTMMTSVVGTRHLLDHCERHGARFMQASTSEIYGDPLEHPQREGYFGNVNPTGPRACYDEGKRAAETLCFDYLRGRGVDVRVARIFNTYGPRMRPDDGRIVSNLVCQALAGEPLTIYGNGEQTRSFCYVDDMIEGFVRLMRVDETPDGPVNLGNPGEFTINELADMVLDLVETTSRVVYEPLPKDDPQRRRPDISRAEAVLGWRPTTPIVEGLPPTIDWFASLVRPARETQHRSRALSAAVPGAA